MTIVENITNNMIRPMSGHDAEFFLDLAKIDCEARGIF